MYRKHAIQKGIIDNPNHRSSHKTPTPTGGGIVTVCGIIAVWAICYGLQMLSIKEFLALTIPGSIIAAVGFFDDKHNLPRRIRFIAQIVSACITISLIYPLPDIQIWQNISIELNGLGIIAVVIGIVWMTNLYNFMDGIDGIAGAEAVTVLAGASLICFINGQVELAAVLITSSLPVYGFLYWNWPPAKIFMGDACSTFLGMTFATLALITSKSEAINLWSWFILLSLFILDATITLLVRIATGQKWREAHRTHLYQKLSLLYGHKTSTSLFIGINFIVLTTLIYNAKLPTSFYLITTLIILTVILRFKPGIKISLVSKSIRNTNVE
ncbi:MraY family glycosyltransferase [Sessilibacter sp. MAH1]